MAYITGKNLKKRWDRFDSDTPSDGVWYKELKTGGDKTQLSVPGGHCARLHQRHVGWSNPNFHRRVKKGELLPHTPYRAYRSEGSTTGSRSLWTNDGALYRYYSEGNYVLYDDWILTENDLLPYVPESAEAQYYIQEAASKIYSNGWDALTFVAELTSVRSMFVDAAKKLLRLSTNLPKFWKKISSTGEWLSYRYGWRTLMYDILDINEVITTWDEQRSRFSDKAGTVWSQSVTNVRTVEYAHYYVDIQVVDKASIALRGSVTADVQIPKILANPVATAWELIPFSFVLDWFVSVGTALEAASFEVLQSQYASSWGYHIEMDRNLLAEIGEVKATFQSGNHDQAGSSKASLKVRVPCGVPKVPHLTLKMDSLKVIDLVALILQRFRR